MACTSWLFAVRRVSLLAYTRPQLPVSHFGTELSSEEQELVRAVMELKKNTAKRCVCGKLLLHLA